MSDLVIKCWFEAPMGPGERLLQAIDIVTGWGQIEDEWQGFSVQESDTYVDVVRNDPASMVALREACTVNSAPSRRVSIHVPFRCWRIKAMQAEPGNVMAWIYANGVDYMRKYRAHADLEGDLTIRLDTVGAHCAHVYRTGEDIDRVNEKIEVNLEALMELLFLLVNEGQASAIKVYSEPGDYFPLNAHVTFFRDLNGLNTDVQLIHKAWHEGFPDYKFPPLKIQPTKQTRTILHRWRDEASQLEILKRLGSVVERVREVRQSDVNALDWGKYDNYEGANGRFVLEYPHFLNAFLDGFYLDLIESL